MFLDHVSNRIDIKTIHKLISYTHAPQSRQIDTRVPFENQDFKLVGQMFGSCV